MTTWNHPVEMIGHYHCCGWTVVSPEVAQDPSAVRAQTRVGMDDPRLIEQGVIADPDLGRDVLVLSQVQAEQFWRFFIALCECEYCRAVIQDAVEMMESNSDKMLCIYRNLLPCFREHDAA